MTSHFDYLGSIYNALKHDADQGKHEFEDIALWLAEICRKQADDKEKDWNFETWQNTKWGQTVKKVYGEKFVIFHYLNACHDKLDHKNWHLKVFDGATATLIKIVYNLIHGESGFGLKEWKLFEVFPQLQSKLEALGFTYMPKQKMFVKNNQQIW